MSNIILSSYFQPSIEIEWEKSSNFLHRVFYHLILFTPKFREILTREIAIELEEIFKEITGTKGYDLLGVVILPNHAHLILGSKPCHFIPNIFKDIGERTSFLIMRRHKDIQKKHRIKKLWSKNFGVETLGDFNIERIKNHLLDLKGHNFPDQWEKHFRGGKQGCPATKSLIKYGEIPDQGQNPISSTSFRNYY